MMGFVWPFLIYTLILYVVSYILVDYGQKYLYDETPPYVALKIGLGALLMAGILTWTKSSFETMFIDDIWKTALLAIVWVGVFILIFRFQPLHGAAFAMVAVLVVPGLATMVVQGALKSRTAASRPTYAPVKAYRKPMATVPAPSAKEGTK